MSAAAASIAGAIVANALFMLGASFLLGGRTAPRAGIPSGQPPLSGVLLLVTAALLIPSAVATADSAAKAAFVHELSVGLAVLLIVAYGLGMHFSLKTHRKVFASAKNAKDGETPWAGAGDACRRHVTGGDGERRDLRRVSAAGGVDFRHDPGVRRRHRRGAGGGAAEIASAFSGVRRNPFDLAVGIALGGASRIALFVAPVLVQ